MNMVRRLIIPVFAAAAVLAGVSAMTAPAIAMAAVAHPASATHLTAASVQNEPASSLPWRYWSSYGTLYACNSEGYHLWAIHSIMTWECVGMNGGEYVYYDLYIIEGQPPGS
jgi:hypothetical protein